MPERADLVPVTYNLSTPMERPELQRRSPRHRLTAALLVAATFECVVQVNGKLRDRVELARGLDSAAVLAAVKQLERVRVHLEGVTIVKEIVVPDKLVSFVVK